MTIHWADFFQVEEDISKNSKKHICTICDREFQSIRNYAPYCSSKCRNYSNTKKYLINLRLGIKVDPHNPPIKNVPKRLKLLRNKK